MSGQKNIYKILYIATGLLALAAIISLYFLPMWWVALKSHQYPETMYPKGIRIEFKYNGVYNGCEGVKEREELATNVGADCLIEMNKINHFIGMYPIVQGVNDWVEITGNTIEMSDKATLEKILALNKGLVKKINDSTLQLTSDTITRLHMPYPIYAADSIPDAEIPKALKILDKIMRYSKWFFVIFAILMLLFLAVPDRKMTWAALLAGLAPFYFLTIYIYYLYWYGHNLGLHGGGAFSGIKPFMPTVLGEGKVAQFTTLSFPDIGFYVGLLGFLLTLAAIYFKKKYIQTAHN
ncbi:MAG: hypothetical protein GXO27_02650 [Chlorobi bacterium]|nr:hypothetical protein [Chlorobiota bacterium]